MLRLYSIKCTHLSQRLFINYFINFFLFHCVNFHLQIKILATHHDHQKLQHNKHQCYSIIHNLLYLINRFDLNLPSIGSFAGYYRVIDRF